VTIVIVNEFLPLVVVPPISFRAARDPPGYTAPKMDRHYLLEFAAYRSVTGHRKIRHSTSSSPTGRLTRVPDLIGFARSASAASTGRCFRFPGATAAALEPMTDSCRAR